MSSYDQMISTVFQYLNNAVKKIFYTALTLYIFSPLPAHSESISTTLNPIKIGVLANRGKEHCLDQWSATANYLTSQIPNHKFTIVPLSCKEIYHAVERNSIDFVLANPAIYVELEAYYGINRLATMENLYQKKGYNVFGGVIFCKAGRNDINNLNDLRGKSFIAVEEHSFGGWIMAYRELRDHGISPYEDLHSLRFGGTHDAVVYAVLDGKVDAGTVRTDILERMAEEGSINLDSFTVLNEHHHEIYKSDERFGFPLKHSTRLYPEWSFAKVKNTPSDLAKEVAIALLHISSDSTAARNAKIVGWTTPLNYQQVRECFKELRLGPYAVGKEVTFSDVINKYLHWILFASGALVVMLFFTAYVLKLNNALSKSKALLTKARDNLESRVKERTQELESVNREILEEVKVRKQAENEAREAHAEIGQIFNTAASGMTVIKSDFTIIKINDTFTRLLGITKKEAEERKCFEIFPSYRCDTEGCPMVQIFGGRERIEVEDIKRTKNGDEITCIITATPYKSSDGELLGIVESFQDISERKRHEIALAEFADELAQSNTELQQFAYVASHDLQEPLRMVASYVQLLARRYKGKLDDDADEFINFAVDGANRMKALIQDLLQYSRVNTKGHEFEPTDCEEVMKRTLENLQLLIEDSGAQITYDPLPTVTADRLQLVQLFQNLISNAIKFHGDNPPLVNVKSKLTDTGWLFSVQDNGIGIDSRYSDKIFDIFQRLHRNEQYKGTGIGLAVSKKIVERHGGKIWVESEPGKGSVFYFVIPFEEENIDDGQGRYASY